MIKTIVNNIEISIYLIILSLIPIVEKLKSEIKLLTFVMYTSKTFNGTSINVIPSNLSVK